MTWKAIQYAPRNGTWLDLGKIGSAYIERGCWGVHRVSGEYCWVDGHGIGLFEPDVFDYPKAPPTKMPNALANPQNRWYDEHDENGDRIWYHPLTGFRISHADYLAVHPQFLAPKE